jgi:hypothetical protein
VLAQVVSDFAQHQHSLLIPDLIGDGARTEEHMWQQALALPPGFVADFRKQGSEQLDHAPLPERLLLLTHPLSDDRLHEPVDTEGLLLHMTAEQRIAIEDSDGFVQEQRVRCHCPKALAEEWRTCAQGFFWDGIGVQKGAEP